MKWTASAQYTRTSSVVVTALARHWCIGGGLLHPVVSRGGQPLRASCQAVRDQPRRGVTGLHAASRISVVVHRGRFSSRRRDPCISSHSFSRHYLHFVHCFIAISAAVREVWNSSWLYFICRMATRVRIAFPAQENVLASLFQRRLRR